MRAPTEPTQSWLRRHSERQRAALAAALRRAEGNSGFRRAADAYDAAALVADRPQGVLDLVAAIVLARDGLMAIADETSAPVPPCFANPLHGRSGYVIPWRSIRIWLPHEEVPVCSACAWRELRIDRRILRAPDGNGRSLLYFQVRGFWSKTGFGAFEPDLPRRVLEHLGVD